MTTGGDAVADVMLVIIREMDAIERLRNQPANNGKIGRHVRRLEVARAELARLKGRPEVPHADDRINGVQVPVPPPSPPHKRRRKHNALPSETVEERLRIIDAGRAEGKSVAKIAAELGLSHQRIYQIEQRRRR